MVRLKTKIACLWLHNLRFALCDLKEGRRRRERSSVKNLLYVFFFSCYNLVKIYSNLLLSLPSFMHISSQRMLIM